MSELYKDERRGSAVPIALIVAGVLVFVINLAVVYTLLVRPSMGGTGFESPGSVVVDVATPGDFTVMHQTAGTFEGQRRASDSGDARGLLIAVTRASDGAPVAFEADDSFTMNVGATQRVTVGRFRAEEAGAYRVEVRGNAKPVVLFVTKWSTRVPFAAVGVLASLQILAIGLVILGVNRLIKTRRAPSAHGRVPA